jgi:ATP-dependent Clp protease ATP-binding subunit ClpX
VGLEQIIEQRLNRKAMGFGAEVRGKSDARLGELFEKVQPEDFLKYGLIPEFIGRLPVVATLDELDERALIRILTEPRNALTKQYEKLLSFEKIKLKFTDGALAAVARKAYTQKTGARGLRAILEEVMLDLMYDAPSQKQIKEVVITEDAILGKHPPIRIFEQDKDAKSA